MRGVRWGCTTAVPAVPSRRLSWVQSGALGCTNGTWGVNPTRTGRDLKKNILGTLGTYSGERTLARALAHVACALGTTKGGALSGRCAQRTRAHETNG